MSIKPPSPSLALPRPPPPLSPSSLSPLTPSFTSSYPSYLRCIAIIIFLVCRSIHRYSVIFSVSALNSIPTSALYNHIHRHSSLRVWLIWHNIHTHLHIYTYTLTQTPTETPKRVPIDTDVRTHTLEQLQLLVKYQGYPLSPVQFQCSGHTATTWCVVLLGGAWWGVCCVVCVVVVVCS